jgi:FKBP-type peptidyl-prolyl cis-trans isomerase SlpA
MIVPAKAGAMPEMDRISITDITDADRKPAAQDDGYDADQVSHGKEVTLHFQLSLTDGSVVDSNFETAPATFTVGDGNLPPGFEQVIYGLRAGEESLVIIAIDDAFGPHNPDNVQVFPRYRFPADLAMEEGLVINFADQVGNDQPGVITAFDAGRVTVDFNHPLAGREIVFHVKVITVKS